jgi:uncharacterized protein YkvS
MTKANLKVAWACRSKLLVSPVSGNVSKLKEGLRTVSDDVEDNSLTGNK